LRPYVNNNPAVCDGAVSWDCAARDKEDSVCAFLVMNALGRSAKFVGKRAGPSDDRFQPLN
jgi:hypothetical protein